MSEVRPFAVRIPPAALDDLTTELAKLPVRGRPHQHRHREAYQGDDGESDASRAVCADEGQSHAVLPTLGRAPLRRIIYWNEAERGGHFAALEQPELFMREVRACFADLQVNG